MWGSKVVLFKVKSFHCRSAEFKLRKQFSQRYFERTFLMKQQNTFLKERDVLARGRSINHHPLHCSAGAYCKPFLQSKGRMMDNITRPCIIMDYHWARSSAELKTISAGHERSAISWLKCSSEGKNHQSLHVQFSTDRRWAKKICSIIAGRAKHLLARRGPNLSSRRPIGSDQIGPGSLFFAGSTVDGQFLHWEEQSRSTDAKTDEWRCRELLFFYPSSAMISFLHPAPCWCCWMSIMESAAGDRGRRRLQWGNQNADATADGQIDNDVHAGGGGGKKEAWFLASCSWL